MYKGRSNASAKDFISFIIHETDAQWAKKINKRYKIKQDERKMKSKLQSWTGHCAIVPWHMRPLRRNEGAPFEKNEKWQPEHLE